MTSEQTVKLALSAHKTLVRLQLALTATCTGNLEAAALILRMTSAQYALSTATADERPMAVMEAHAVIDEAWEMLGSNKANNERRFIAAAYSQNFIDSTQAKMGTYLVSAKNKDEATGAIYNQMRGLYPSPEYGTPQIVIDDIADSLILSYAACILRNPQ